jgi:hypothetical protein
MQRLYGEGTYNDNADDLNKEAEYLDRQAASWRKQAEHTLSVARGYDELARQQLADNRPEDAKPSMAERDRLGKEADEEFKKTDELSKEAAELRARARSKPSRPATQNPPATPPALSAPPCLPPEKPMLATGPNPPASTTWPIKSPVIPGGLRYTDTEYGETRVADYDANDILVHETYYNSAGRVIGETIPSKTTPGGYTTTYTDSLGRRTVTEWTSEYEEAFGYDANGVLRWHDRSVYSGGYYPTYEIEEGFDKQGRPTYRDVYEDTPDGTTTETYQDFNADGTGKSRTVVYRNDAIVSDTMTTLNAAQGGASGSSLDDTLKKKRASAVAMQRAYRTMLSNVSSPQNRIFAVGGSDFNLKLDYKFGPSFSYGMGGALTPVAGGAQQPCAAKAECDRLRAAADQAEKDAAAAKTAVTQAEADQKKAIDDAHRLDVEAENQSLLYPDNRISDNFAISSAKHKQAQTLRDNAAAALKRAQDEAATKSKAAADARAAADACRPCPEENKTAEKTGPDTTPSTSTPPDNATAATGNAAQPTATNAASGTPQTASQAGGPPGAKADEFAGGTETRRNLPPDDKSYGGGGYVVTRTSKDGSIVEETSYSADGKAMHTRRTEPSQKYPGGTKISFLYDGRGPDKVMEKHGSLTEVTETYANGRVATETFFPSGSQYGYFGEVRDSNGNLISRLSVKNNPDGTYTQVAVTYHNDGTRETVTTVGRHVASSGPDDLGHDETISKQTTVTQGGLDQVGQELGLLLEEEEAKAGAAGDNGAKPAPKDIPPPTMRSEGVTEPPRDIIGSAAGSHGAGSVAVGDVNGSGNSNFVVGAGFGGRPLVQVLNGKTGLPLASFYAYDQSYRGGVNVAVGDIDGDGRGEIITAPASGGNPQVNIFDSVGNYINKFGSFPNTLGGVSVSAADLNGDGKAEIVAGSGPGGPSQVQVFTGTGQLLNSFYPYGQSYTGGINVGVGDFGNGTGILTSTGSPTRPQFRAFNYSGLPMSLDQARWGDYKFSFRNSGGTGGNMSLGGDFGWSLLPKRAIEQLPESDVTPGGGIGVILDPSMPVYTRTSRTLFDALDDITQRGVIDLGPPPPPPGALQRGSGSTVADSRSAAHLQLAAFHPTPGEKPRQQATAGTQSSSAPQSSAAANPGEIEFAIVSNGKTGDNALQIQIFDPAGEVKEMPPLGGVVIEPVKQGGDRSSVKSIAERHAGAAGLLTQQVSAFCLDFLKLPPEAGTLYRIAPQAVQEKFKPLRSILQAGHRLADNGQLHPDSDPKDYAAFVRQYALWTKIENWDAKKFTDMFLEQSKKNAEVLDIKWSKEMEDVLRGLAPGRWQDIAAVLNEAEAISKSGAAKPGD